MGYGIDEAYRGKSYASKTCRIIKQVAISHGMDKVIITCDPDNWASRRTCEEGLKLKEIANLPPHNVMYLEDERQKCIFGWILRV
ncbi:GNAT family N-acetyltransferase [Clostridium estertheticum]|uniref:GNAT family N-acetyltransferase n=1 Tax=Clostridium estertheticum TaxID=238834 RepID=UPI001CD11384|nr:GNAT family N-acetyltransferase [Clostridium estertheticum]MBZ9687099.1 GNAT family N-acetyltransferase [Clostridium estertheticum]